MRISDWSSDVCSSDLFVGHVGSHRGNLSEENPALYRRRGCLTCFVAGNPPGTGSGGGVTVFETTPLVLSKRRSEEHTSELQSLMRISYAVFCLKKKRPCNYPYLHLQSHTITTPHTIL